MSWRDQLQPASFRGVEFHAVQRSATYGRRNQVHEYPFRDLPYVEDLGRMARSLRIVGFLVGKDVLRKRDALIAAIEQPGSGKLIHPTLGEMTVSVVGGVTIDESDHEAGIVRITFNVTESGELRFPSADAATQDVVARRADAAGEALQQAAARRLDTRDLPAFAEGLSLQRAERLVAAVRTAAALVGSPDKRGALLAAIALLEPGLAATLRAPVEFATRVYRLVEDLLSGLSGADRDAVMASLADFGRDEIRWPELTTTRRRDGGNRAALEELVRGAAAIALARSAAEAEFVDYQGAADLRDLVLARLDDVADNTADDAVFGALSNLRAAVVRDITTRGADLARVATILPPHTAPALVLAYGLYDDAGRDAELVQRNRIRHPGFVPAGQPLEVAIDG